MGVFKGMPKACGILADPHAGAQSISPGSARACSENLPGARKVGRLHGQRLLVRLHAQNEAAGGLRWIN